MLFCFIISHLLHHISIVTKDTHGKQAQAVKRRCMNVLGFDEYTESLTDGLQVLRYNQTTAYVPHLDWIDDYQKQQEHNCEFYLCILQL